MTGQISLDAFHISHLSELLTKGSEIVKKTGMPIILYRQTLEEEGDSYEEIVCSLTPRHVIEQVVVSGGMIVPTFRQQNAYTFGEYSKMLQQKSADRFLEVVAILEEHLAQVS